MPGTLDARQLHFVTTYVAVPLGGPVAGGDEGAGQAVLALRAQLGEDVALLDNPETAKKLAAALGAIDTLIDGGQQGRALAQLQKIAELMASQKGAARAAEASRTIPEGMVGDTARTLELDIATLRTSRLRTVAGLEELTRRLREEEDGDLHRIADRIDGLRKDLPEKLEAVLERMKVAIEAGEPGKAADEKAIALGLVGEAATYLQDNQTELALCEENPFGITLEVVRPLAGAVQSVRQSLARL